MGLAMRALPVEPTVPNSVAPSEAAHWQAISLPPRGMEHERRLGADPIGPPQEILRGHALEHD